VQALSYASGGRGGRGRGRGAGEAARGAWPAGRGGTGGGVSLKTLWLHREYQTAKLWQVEVPDATPIKGVKAEDYAGMEFRLPDTVQGYFAIELE